MKAKQKMWKKKLQKNVFCFHTSLECKRAGSTVCSPDELNVQWNDSAGGDASTSHFNDKVSCFRAPSNSS